MQKSQQAIQSPLPWKRILASTVLLFLSYEPLNFTALTFLSLIPWFSALRDSKNNRESIKISFILGALFCLTSFFWVARVVHQFGNLSWPTSILLLGLYALIAEPSFAICAPVFRKILILQKSLGAHFSFTYVLFLSLTGASLFAIVDWTLPKLFVDTFGHGYAPWLTVLQLSEITGPMGLTWLWMFTALQVYFVAQFESENGFLLKRTLYHITPLISLWGVVLMFGNIRISQIDRIYSQSNAPALRVIGIQANIEDAQKLLAEQDVRRTADFVLDTYKTLTKQAVQNHPDTDLVVWPETAYPSAFLAPDTPREKARDQDLLAFISSLNIPIAFGGYGMNHERLPTNTLIYAFPDGTVTTYAKSILLLFGETLPFVDSLPWMRLWFPMIGFFGKGPGPTVSNLKHSRLLSMICYEALFPWFSQEGLRSGAQWILNVTNDSWFGSISAPDYHLSLVRLRSIETRVPQLRITNTGYTALIEPTGIVSGKTSLFEQATPYYELKLLEDPKNTSLYSRCYPVYTLFLLIVAALGGYRVWRARLPSKTP